MAKVTQDGRRSRKCRDACLDGSERGECQCACGFNCHGRGYCEPELHTYDAIGHSRLPNEYRAPTEQQAAAMAAMEGDQ